MAGLSDAGAEVTLGALGAVATLFSLHSADPGTTGANELAGGAPAYARQPGAWGAAAGRQMVQSGEEVFDIPALADVAYWGAWSADGDTFYVGGLLDNPETYTGQGQYKLTGAKVQVP